MNRSAYTRDPSLPGWVALPEPTGDDTSSEYGAEDDEQTIVRPDRPRPTSIRTKPASTSAYATVRMNPLERSSVNEQVDVNKDSSAGTHEVSPTTASSPIRSFKHPVQASASSQLQKLVSSHEGVPNRVTENISKDKNKEGESSSSSYNFSQSQPVSKPQVRRQKACARKSIQFRPVRPSELMGRDAARKTSQSQVPISRVAGSKPSVNTPESLSMFSMSRSQPNSRRGGIDPPISFKGKGKDNALSNDSEEELVDSPIHSFMSDLSKKRNAAANIFKDTSGRGHEGKRNSSTIKVTPSNKNVENSTRVGASSTSHTSDSTLSRDKIGKPTRGLKIHSPLSKQPQASQMSSFRSRPSDVEPPASQRRGKADQRKTIAIIDISSDEEGAPTSRKVSVIKNYGRKDNPVVINDSDDDEPQEKPTTTAPNEQELGDSSISPVTSKPNQYTKIREPMLLSDTTEDERDVGTSLMGTIHDGSASPFTKLNDCYINETGNVTPSSGPDQPTPDFSRMEVDDNLTSQNDFSSITAIEAGVEDVQINDADENMSIKPADAAENVTEDARMQDDAEVDHLLGLSELLGEHPANEESPKDSSNVVHVVKNEETTPSFDFGALPLEEKDDAKMNEDVTSEKDPHLKEGSEDTNNTVARPPSQHSSATPLRNMFGFYKGKLASAVEQTRHSPSRTLSNSPKTVMETPLKVVKARLASPKSPSNASERQNNGLSSPSPLMVEIPEPIPLRRLAAAESLRDALQAEKRIGNHAVSLRPEVTDTSNSSSLTQKVESKPKRYSDTRTRDVMKARQEGQMLLSLLGLSAGETSEQIIGSSTPVKISASSSASLNRTTDDILQEETTSVELNAVHEQSLASLDNTNVENIEEDVNGISEPRPPTDATESGPRGLINAATFSTSSLTSASTLDSSEIGSPINKASLELIDIDGNDYEELADFQILGDHQDRLKRGRSSSKISNTGSYLLSNKRARIELDGETSNANIEITQLVDISVEPKEIGNMTSMVIRHSRKASAASSADPIDSLDEQTVKRESSPEGIDDQTQLLRGINWSLAERMYKIFYKRVDEIPKELVNEINDMPSWSKDPALLRKIFESSIRTNTVDDEPNAPHIRILNDVDDEATPPFEFHYSNHLWHGKGVPPPDLDNLESCDCTGKCDPASTTCACAIRQRALFETYGMEAKTNAFNYDEKGRLRDDQFPIFECNAFCGCTDDCQNRVVQLGRTCHIDIVKTQKKGWGVFARKKIFKGSFIGIYSGEIITEAEAGERGKLYDSYGRTYLFDIDYWHLKEHEDDVSRFSVDAFHAGNFTRYLNHSCDPNCRIVACHINDAITDKAILCVFSIKDIDAQQELTFHYAGPIADDDEAQTITEMTQPTKKIHQRCECGSRNCTGVIFACTVEPEDLAADLVVDMADPPSVP